MPRPVPAESSPTIAPMTLAIAASRKPLNSEGMAEGMRTVTKVCSRVALRERMSSMWIGSAELRPRKVLTVTGKNER